MSRGVLNALLDMGELIVVTPWLGGLLIAVRHENGVSETKQVDESASYRVLVLVFQVANDHEATLLPPSMEFEPKTFQWLVASFGLSARPPAF